MRARGVIQGAMALLLTAGVGRAQQREEGPGVALQRVDVRMGVGQARVELTYRIEGDESGWVMTSLPLPERGLVVGARVRRGGDWLVGQLREAEKANEAFWGDAESEKVGAFRALFAWDGAGSVRVHAMPLAASESPTLHLTTLAPTRYEGGRDQVDLSALVVPGVEVVIHGEGRLALNEGDVHEGLRWRPGKEERVVVGFEPRSRPPLSGQLASVAVGEASLLRMRFGAARRVSRAPEKAGVVVLIDDSRSMREEQRLAARELARDYLSRLPDAQASVVFFDRTLHPAHPVLLPSAQAARTLAQHGRARNGSRLDLALAQAGELLRDYPGPRRILVLTDGATSRKLTTERLREVSALGGALVHVGIVPERALGGVQLDAEHPWAEATRPTGGLVWLTGRDEAVRGAVDTEALVRPTTIEALTVKPGPTSRAFEKESWPERLVEGEGFEAMKMAPDAPGVVIEGKLWTETVRLVLTPQPDAAWSTLVVGSPLFSALDDKAQRAVAARSGAVTPFTSLFAAQPGPRGLGGLGGMSGSFDSGGSHDIGLGTMGLGRGRKVRIPSGAPLERAWRQCTGGQGGASLEVELTGREVVDVPRVELRGVGAEARRCVEEALWDMEFPATSYHGVLRVELPRPL